MGLAYPLPTALSVLLLPPNRVACTNPTLFRTPSRSRRPPALRRLPRVLQLAAKALFQLLTMLWMLLVTLPRPDVILLQVSCCSCCCRE